MLQVLYVEPVDSGVIDDRDTDFSSFHPYPFQDLADGSYQSF